MKQRNELEFVGCRSVALTLAVAGAFLVGLAGKVGWHVTTRILRARESRRQ